MLAVLDGAVAVEQGRQAIDERARDLPLDLRRIDDVAGIGGGDDAVHLDLVAVGDGDFGRTRDVAAVAHVLAMPRYTPCGGGLSQPIFSATALSTARCFGCFAHQLAPEFDRILADRMRQLVHEAFEIDRVLVDVDAAPEARRDVGIAHGMLDQQVRKGVADRPVAGGSEALEGGRVHAVDQCRRAHRVQDGLAGDPDMQRRQIVVLVEGAGQFALVIG